MKIISIVVPVYNEQENIIHFYREICNVMKTTNYDFQLFFVNDGSSDASAELIRELEEKDTHVKGLFLARNFGHQVALTCGLDHANGDAVITMDGDMQHPPELIPLLLEKWEAGFEVVQTIRETTEGVSWLKKMTSSCYYKVLNNMANIHIQEGGSDFRLMDQVVVRSFRRYKEQARFIRGMIGAMGYKQTQIEFVAPKRFAGTSKFSPRKMLHFALDGITAYSNLPLRLSLYGGLLSGLISFLLVLHVLFIKIFTYDAVPGWATIAASILFLGGIQLTVLGIIGEYIGRIFAEVKQRPLYLLEREPENEIEK
ncbi:glycosyltransferase family 2 protein [Propionispira raffinosivorans]|uniref:glycosyltransferase family 2 protein n=1 Tax=Propionispira raffinosivorans TaxID=86959 RepID=UPI0003662028|nr:glycosyltransferase family 2 protein [Propionispira raffinosivorans]